MSINRRTNLLIEKNIYIYKLFEIEFTCNGNFLIGSEFNKPSKSTSITNSTLSNNFASNEAGLNNLKKNQIKKIQ